jgi:arsenate reductase (thioredoxin)
MAAAFFNAIVDGSLAKGISAGTQPGDRVHPVVVEVMKEIGIDLSAARLQLLTEDLARGSQMLVTMGCGESCPVVSGVKREDWPLEDPKGQPLEKVRGIRDEIRERVQKLIEREGWRRQR